MIEKSNSTRLTLATIAILGQPPRCWQEITYFPHGGKQLGKRLEIRSERG